jgi:adenosylcobinamide-phosphate synthase
MARPSLIALATALALDLAGGEPPARLHPVVWMGRTIAALEQRAPSGRAARLVYGAGMAAATLALFTIPAWLLERRLSRFGFVGALALGACLKPAFAIRALWAAARRVEQALQRDDLDGAREALRSLVSRKTATLSPPLLAAAAIESVAENASDSIVAPLFYYALLGLPGATAYRVINTLDAMVGYRTARYEHLGKAAARLDDLANLVPARLTALALVAAAPLAGGSAAGAWQALRRDHGATASPNAGWPMSAAAGALGVVLEKVGHYRLNAAARGPEAADIARALALTRAALPLALAPLLVFRRASVRRRGARAARPGGRIGERREVHAA